MADLAELASIEAAWRPLTEAEKTRATYYLGAASRRIRRRWRDVDDRLGNGQLDPADVSDVVVDLVIGALGGPPVRGAKSFSEGVGPMSRSATLAEGRTDPLFLEDWMIAVFEGEPDSSPQPVFSMPPSGRYENVFVWPEGCV